jgi:hypothetical protein
VVGGQKKPNLTAPLRAADHRPLKLMRGSCVKTRQYEKKSFAFLFSRPVFFF